VQKLPTWDLDNEPKNQAIHSALDKKITHQIRHLKKD
jgi:hypothetical protein